MEFSIGNRYSAHVILHLRRQDILWFNSNIDYHEAQILTLVKEEIMPREFPALFGSQSSNSTSAEIKKSTAQTSRKRQLQIGGGNFKQRSQKGKDASTPSSPGGSAATEITNPNKGKKATYSPDVTMIFGETLQLTYKMEEIAHSSVTLKFKDLVDEEIEYPETSGRTRKRKNLNAQTIKLATFRQLTTLPKRIVCWCYSFDPNDPTAPNPLEGGGFPRPETIPILSLFVRKDDNAEEE